MKLTSEPKRIENAHSILQRLEDEVVGCMAPTNAETVKDCEAFHVYRLNQIHDRVWEAIRQLNEAYDTLPRGV